MRPLRTRDPKAIHLLTGRTQRAECWMVPSRRIRRIIGGIIGRYQKVHNVKIYAFIFLSNHYHMLASQADGNIWKFMYDVNREIAKRVNKEQGREGSFWARRYTSQVVLSDNDLIEAYAYILTNAVHQRLVENPEEWPGLTSQNCIGRLFPFVNLSCYAAARRKDPSVCQQDYTSYYEIEISPLPLETPESAEEHDSTIRARVRSKLTLLKKTNTRGYLGRKKVLSQKPGARPRKVKRSPRSGCYSKCPKLIQKYRKYYRDLIDTYREASERFRLGELEVSFPEFTFKPPLHHRPSRGSMVYVV